ncbi:hypothetical protein HE1_00027 [Holospora elegans E1]|uniref:Uncharacterized protein n=1 Tax=Holospora elegans E1 TaxID=1427503 RepID=A0A023DWE9_9PROT|nr:hypothetical protein HE1_00027 [Holospora elegans E1]
MKVVLLMICQERMSTLIKASGVMALMTGEQRGANTIGALISKYNYNWFDIWFTKGGTSWVQRILLPNLPKKVLVL